MVLAAEGELVTNSSSAPRRALTEDEILDAALGLLDDGGVTAASVEPVSSQRPDGCVGTWRTACGCRERCHGIRPAHTHVGEFDDDPERRGRSGGWERLVRTFRWVGSRYSGGTGATSEVQVLGLGDKLAYTVGYEGQVTSVDGAPEAPMRLWVTHIYRHEDGEWRLVRRHADLAPPDQSPDEGQVE
jgi:hypothetical protein